MSCGDSEARPLVGGCTHPWPELVAQGGQRAADAAGVTFHAPITCDVVRVAGVAELLRQRAPRTKQLVECLRSEPEVWLPPIACPVSHTIVCRSCEGAEPVRGSGKRLTCRLPVPTPSRTSKIRRRVSPQLVV